MLNVLVSFNKAIVLFSSATSKVSPAKNETKPDTEFSPIKKTTKKNSKKILDDSDDEGSGNVNGSKEEIKSDKEDVNGSSTKTSSAESGNMETGSVIPVSSGTGSTETTTETGSIKTDSPKSGSIEKIDQVLSTPESSNNDGLRPSCSTSSDDNIPRRKTGIFNTYAAAMRLDAAKFISFILSNIR